MSRTRRTNLLGRPLADDAIAPPRALASKAKRLVAIDLDRGRNWIGAGGRFDRRRPDRFARRATAESSVGSGISSGPRSVTSAAAGAPVDQMSNDGVPATNRAGASPSDGAAGAPAGQEQVGNVDDDGQTLWASPTAGPPLELKYLTGRLAGDRGAAVGRAARARRGAKAVRCLGAGGRIRQNALHAALGVDLQQVEQIAIAFSSNEAGGSQACYVMHLKQADRRCGARACLGTAGGRDATNRRSSIAKPASLTTCRPAVSSA